MRQRPLVGHHAVEVSHYHLLFIHIRQKLADGNCDSSGKPRPLFIVINTRSKWKKNNVLAFFFDTFNLFLLLIDQAVVVCKNDTAVRRQHFDLCRSDVEVLQSPPPATTLQERHRDKDESHSLSARHNHTVGERALRLCDAAGRVSAQHNSRAARQKKNCCARSYVLSRRLQWSSGCGVCCTVSPLFRLCVFVCVTECMTASAWQIQFYVFRNPSGRNIFQVGVGLKTTCDSFPARNKHLAAAQEYLETQATPPTTTTHSHPTPCCLNLMESY